MNLLQLGLQCLEVADGVLQGGVRAQGLKLHQVATDVVQTHVGEPAPGGEEGEGEGGKGVEEGWTPL